MKRGTNQPKWRTLMVLTLWFSATAALTLNPAMTHVLAAEDSARLGREPWAFQTWEVEGNLAEGTRIDLTPCATMLVLLNVETALPDLVG